MIVFDLKCSGAGHVFEAWFRSSEDYEDQKARGLLVCPVCGDTGIGKAVMAPGVPAKSNQRPETPPASLPVSSGMDEQALRNMVEQLAKAQAEILKDSEWVGRDFADTARAMHYGEQDAKPIHGEVAPDEARSLLDEGVEIAPLPLPVVPPKAQN